MELKLDRRLWPVAALGLFLAVIAGYWLLSPSKVLFKPVPDSALKSNPDYPPFRSGILTVFAEGQEHKIALAENTESIYKGLPKSVMGTAVVATLDSPYWKLKAGTLTLKKTTIVDLVPNGSLAILYGNVVDESGSPVREASIRIGTDTVLYTNNQGIFKAELSYSHQKENQPLTISKSGYVAQQINHRPGGNLVVRMPRAVYGGGKMKVVEKEKEDSFGTFVAKEAIRAGFRKHR